MVLFILGNGFDIAHNMKTSYCDFEEFVMQNYSDKKHLYDNQYEVNNLWSNFEANLAKLDIDYLLGRITGIFELDGDENDIVDIRSDGWFSDVITKNLVSADELKYIFQKWVESIEIPTQPSKRKYDITDNQECLYINFNYTTVLEKLYKINERNILYIHGSAEKGIGSIIVGHGSPDFYAEMPVYKYEDGEEVEPEGIDLSGHASSEEEKIMLESIATYLNDLKKPTSKVNRELINFLAVHSSLKKINKICVFGHSCGAVDMPYFLSIQNFVGKSIEWEIAYHNKKHIKNMKQRLIDTGLDVTNIKFVSDTFVDYMLR